jgi:hypothetical protein
MQCHHRSSQLPLVAQCLFPAALQATWQLHSKEAHHQQQQQAVLVRAA